MSKSEDRIRKALGLLAGVGRIRLFRAAQKAPKNGPIGWYYRAPKDTEWQYLGRSTEQVVCRSRAYCALCLNGPIEVDPPSSDLLYAQDYTEEPNGQAELQLSRAEQTEKPPPPAVPSPEPAIQASEPLGTPKVSRWTTWRRQERAKKADETLATLPPESSRVLLVLAAAEYSRIGTLRRRRISSIEGRPVVWLPWGDYMATVADRAVAELIVVAAAGAGLRPEILPPRDAERSPVWFAFTPSAPPVAAYVSAPNQGAQDTTPPLFARDYLDDETAGQWASRYARAGIGISTGSYPWQVGAWRRARTPRRTGRAISQLRTLPAAAFHQPATAKPKLLEEARAAVSAGKPLLPVEASLLRRSGTLLLAAWGETGDAILTASKEADREVLAWVTDYVQVPASEIATSLTEGALSWELVRPSADDETLLGFVLRSRLAWATQTAPTPQKNISQFASGQRVVLTVAGKRRVGTVTKTSALSVRVVLDPEAGERTRKIAFVRPQELDIYNVVGVTAPAVAQPSRPDPAVQAGETPKSAATKPADDARRAQPSGPTLRVALVGCSAKQIGASAPAKELFVGSLYKLARRYAEACADEWLLLSAEYGVVDPGTEIEPYTTNLSALSDLDVRKWGEANYKKLRDRYKGRAVEFLGLAGKIYLTGLDELKLQEPLQGMGIAQRIRWLTEQIAECERRSPQVELTERRPAKSETEENRPPEARSARPQIPAVAKLPATQKPDDDTAQTGQLILGLDAVEPPIFVVDPATAREAILARVKVRANEVELPGKDLSPGLLLRLVQRGDPKVEWWAAFTAGTPPFALSRQASRAQTEAAIALADSQELRVDSLQDVIAAEAKRSLATTPQQFAMFWATYRLRLAERLRRLLGPDGEKTLSEAEQRDAGFATFDRILRAGDRAHGRLEWFRALTNSEDSAYIKGAKAAVERFATEAERSSVVKESSPTTPSESAESRAQRYREAAKRQRSKAQELRGNIGYTGSITGKRAEQAAHKEDSAQGHERLARIFEALARRLVEGCEPVVGKVYPCLPDELSVFDEPSVVERLFYRMHYSAPKVQKRSSKALLEFLKSTPDGAKSRSRIQAIVDSCDDDYCNLPLDGRAMQELLAIVRWAKRQKTAAEYLTKLKDLEDDLKVSAELWNHGITSAEIFKKTKDSLLALAEAGPRSEQSLRVKLLAEAQSGGIPGYVPTPADYADKLVGLAGLKPGDRILEPHGGTGAIAAAIRRAGHEPDVVERNETLRQILGLDGYKLVGNDFLELPPTPTYDAIIANPPFEDSQDALHFRHAWKLLRPGGRAVFIVSASTFNEPGTKAQQEFRAFLRDINAYTEKLPADLFSRSIPRANVSGFIVSARKDGSAAPPGASVSSEPGGEQSIKAQPTRIAQEPPQPPTLSKPEPTRQEVVTAASFRADGTAWADKKEPFKFTAAPAERLSGDMAAIGRLGEALDDGTAAVVTVKSEHAPTASYRVTPDEGYVWWVEEQNNPSFRSRVQGDDEDVALTNQRIREAMKRRWYKEDATAFISEVYPDTFRAAEMDIRQRQERERLQPTLEQKIAVWLDRTRFLRGNDYVGVLAKPYSIADLNRAQRWAALSPIPVVNRQIAGTLRSLARQREREAQRPANAGEPDKLDRVETAARLLRELRRVEDGK